MLVYFEGCQMTHFFWRAVEHIHSLHRKTVLLLNFAHFFVLISRIPKIRQNHTQKFR